MVQDICESISSKLYLIRQPDSIEANKHVASNDMDDSEVPAQANEEVKSLSEHSSKSSRSSGSLHTRSSARSSASTRASMVAVQARAESQAAKARAAFAQKEIEIKLEKARLEATLDAL